MKATQNKRLQAILRSQAGVVSLEQAYAAEVPDYQCRTLLRNRTWERVGRGVFRVTGSPATWEQRLWSACLQTGGIASHRTAGWLHRLDGIGQYPPRDLEVLVAFENQRKAKDVKVRRSRTLRDDHIWKGAGIPRTNLARTVIDLSEVLDDGDLSKAFDSALRKQSDLRQWIKRLMKPMSTFGHRGIARLSFMLDEKHAAVDSALEDAVRRLLQKAKLPEPVTGYPVEDIDGGFVTKVDFAWPRNVPPVALMAHGIRYHGDTDQSNTDNWQVRKMSALGWRVLPLTMKDVASGAKELIEDIRLSLRGYQQPPPPKVVVYE